MFRYWPVSSKTYSTYHSTYPAAQIVTHPQILERDQKWNKAQIWMEMCQYAKRNKVPAYIKNLTFFQKFSIFNLILLALVAGMEMSYHDCMSGVSNFIDATTPHVAEPAENLSDSLEKEKAAAVFLIWIAACVSCAKVAAILHLPAALVIATIQGVSYTLAGNPTFVALITKLATSEITGQIAREIMKVLLKDYFVPFFQSYFFSSSPAVGEPMLVYPEITPEMYAEFQRHLEMLSFLDTVSIPFICFVVASLLLHATLFLHSYIYHKNVSHNVYNTKGSFPIFFENKIFRSLV